MRITGFVDSGGHPPAAMMRKVVLPCLIVLAIAAVTIPSGRCESLVLGELAVAGQIGQGFRLYQGIHGAEPTSWAEIESLFERSLDERNPSYQPTQRYAFLRPSVDLPNSTAKIVILSRSPFYDQYAMRGFFGPIRGSLPSALIRYGIVVDPEGNVSTLRFREAHIQEVFAKAGRSLPDPDPLGPRPYESANRLALWVFVPSVLIGVGFAFWCFIFPLIRKAVSWTPKENQMR